MIQFQMCCVINIIIVAWSSSGITLKLYKYCNNCTLVSVSLLGCTRQELVPYVSYFTHYCDKIHLLPVAME